MKKFITLLVIFLFMHSFCLYADAAKSSEKEARSFEIGLANLNVNFFNSFLSIEEVFHDVVVIDIDKLSDGFRLNFGLNVTPFYFTFNSKKGWSFGLSTEVETIGILGVSGKMLTISQAVKDNSDISGALFASATINTSFYMQKFKVNLNPSLFYALAYITPSPGSSSGIMYKLDYPDGGTVLCVDYDIRLYTGFPLDSNDGSSLTSKPGLDFSIGVEYPLAKETGLSKILPFLDFDLSLNLIHVPFIPSKITDYKQIKGRMGSDKPITFFNGDSNTDDNFFSSFDTNSAPEIGKEEIEVSRPFKMILSADWRPLFGAKLLTISPLIGFCYNSLYYEPFSFEIGVNGCLNLANFFMFKVGFNYTDRIFINSVGIVINLRVFELDIGADLRSQTVPQSWTGGGFGVNVGLKFGW